MAFWGSLILVGILAVSVAAGADQGPRRTPQAPSIWETSGDVPVESGVVHYVAIRGRIVSVDVVRAALADRQKASEVWMCSRIK